MIGWTLAEHRLDVGSLQSLDWNGMEWWNGIVECLL